MSKSKGEFLTLSLLIERGYLPAVYRLFCLQSHYRRNLVFSWDNLENAKSAYDKLIARIAALKDSGNEVDADKFAEGRAQFTAALDNDLNTSLAITALYDVFKLNTNDETKLALIKDFDRVLSLDLIKNANEAKKNEESDIPEELLSYINERIEARRIAKRERDFQTADAIRAELLERGITILDTREGTVFKLDR